jgi:AraC-like DNA-binding protein
MGFEIFQTGIYVYVVNRMLTQTEKNLKNIRSGIEPLKINWLKKLNLIFIVYLVLKVCSLYFLMQIEYLLEVEYVLTLALSVIIYFIGYSSINLHEMFVNEIPVNEHPKYEKSALTKDQVLELSKSIKKLMETEKPYLRQELKLSDLAALLSVSTNHLSQLLNKELKTNFYDFINEYRVNEAKKQLNGQRKLNQTILSIAFESGFSNKASFNRIFKKHTGTTPTNYSKSILSISGN